MQRKSTSPAPRLTFLAVLSVLLFTVQLLPPPSSATPAPSQGASSEETSFFDGVLADARHAVTTVGGWLRSIWGGRDAQAELPTEQPPAREEIVERRTRNSKTYPTDEPGKFEAEIYSGPIHFKDPLGKWQDIDTKLVEGGPGVFRNGANEFGLEVAANQRETVLARIALEGGTSIGFGLEGARPGSASPDGASISYRGILPGVDLDLRSTPTGLKDEIVLRSRNAPSSYLFPLVLIGLTAEIDERGAIVYRDLDGKVQAISPPGWMVDSEIDPSSGEGAFSSGVSYRLVPYGDGTALEVRLDQAWIDDPARKFPIRVDPPTGIVTGPDDTFVHYPYYNNFSYENNIKTGTYDSGAHKVRPFLHFDFSLVAGKQVTSASLNLFNYHSWSCVKKPVWAYRVTSDWKGRDLYTWDQQPSLGEAIGNTDTTVGYSSGCPDAWIAMDVTGAVQNWVSGGWVNHGLGILTNETDNLSWKRFYAHDNGTLQPNIAVAYTEANTAPYAPDQPTPSDGAVLTTSPTSLKARYRDPEGTSGQIQFKLYTSGGTLKADKTSTTVSSGSQASVTITSLADGSYEWQARSYDGQAWSGWSYFDFVLDADAPAKPSVSSTTHPTQTSWYSKNDPALSWSATDASGISGYSYALDQEAGTIPDKVSEGTGKTKTYADLADGVWYFHVRAKNGVGMWGDTAHFKMQIDTVDPLSPVSVTASHLPNVGSADRTVDASWSPGVDERSGISGFSYTFNNSETTPANTSMDVAGTSVTSSSLANGVWWFHVRSVDKAGNAGPDKNYGPIVIDPDSSPDTPSPRMLGIVAQSDELGLEQFYAYRNIKAGPAQGLVNLRNGNLVFQHTLAEVPGQGLNTILKLNYNRHRDETRDDEGLGPGWLLSVLDADTGLEGISEGATGVAVNSPVVRSQLGEVVAGVFQATGMLIELTDGDGTTHRFVRQGLPGSKWESPAGVSLRVREVLNELGVATAYEFVRTDGVVYEASQPLATAPGIWRITEVKDRSGNKLTFTYIVSGGGNDPQVRLNAVTHSRTGTQRILEFRYKSQGTLLNVTSLPNHNAVDPADGVSKLWGRLITFEVGGLNRLDRITEGGRSYSFQYETPSTIRLTKITDPRGKFVSPTFEAYTDPETGEETERVKTVTDRRGKLWSFEYSDADTELGQQTTTVTNPVGNQTHYLLSLRKAISGDDPRVAGANVLRITDPGADSGPVVSNYLWQENLMTSRTDGAGATTSYEYNSMGLLTKVTEPSPNDPSRSDLPPGAPASSVVSNISYRYPEAFRYPGSCGDPLPGPGPVSDEGACHQAAELAGVNLASNVAGQTRISEFNHDSKGRMTSAIMRARSDGLADSADRITGFSYHNFGGLKQLDGPRSDLSDITTFGDTSDADYGGYHQTGLPAKITDPTGKQKIFGYTPYGMLAKTTDRDGRVTTNTYDGRDNLTAATDPSGGKTAFVYDLNDNRTEETTPRGTATGTVGDFTTRHTFDADDNLTEVSRPGKDDVSPRSATRFSYNDDGTKATETSPISAVTSFEYWPNKSLKKTIAPAGTGQQAVTESFYDSAGRMRLVRNPSTNAAGARPETETFFTPQGLRASISETASLGDRVVTTLAYNAHGEQIQSLGPREIDSLKEEQTQSYDSFGQVLSLRRRADASRLLDTTYSFDPAGNQVKTTQETGDGQVLEWTYAYDALGRLTAQTSDPENPGHTVAYSYDGEGNQTNRSDYSASGATLMRSVATTYNPNLTVQSEVSTDHVLGKTKSECNFADGAGATTGYDPDRNLLTTRTVEGTTGCTGGTTAKTQTFSYDQRAWMTSTTQTIRSPSAGSGIARTQDFAHNLDGTVSSFTHAGATTYTYSPAGWAESAIDFRSKTTTWSYRPSGAPSSVSLGSGAASGAYAHHADGSLESLVWTSAGRTVRSHSGIAYDRGGLRLSEQVSALNPDDATLSGTASYGYDLARRLTSSASPYPLTPSEVSRPSTTYTLDDAGNITAQSTRVDGVFRVQANSSYVNNRVTSRREETFAVPDLVGGQVVDDAFSHNSLGDETSQATTVTELAPPSSSTSTATSSYDPSGRGDAVTDTRGFSVDYGYDASEQLSTRSETEGATTHTLFFYLGKTNVVAEEADEAGTAKVTYLLDPNGETLGQNNGDGSFTWLLTDPHGNVGTLVSDSGAVIEQKAYTPHGGKDAGGSKRTSDSSAPSSTLGFQSMVTDEKTGNLLAGPRIYDPTTARFTTPDFFFAAALDIELASDPLTGNRFLFAGANPVAYYDDGYWACDDGPETWRRCSAGARRDEERIRQKEYLSRENNGRISKQEQTFLLASPTPERDDEAGGICQGPCQQGKENFDLIMRGGRIPGLCLLNFIVCSKNITIALSPLVFASASSYVFAAGVGLCLLGGLPCLAGGPLILAGAAGFATSVYLAYEVWFGPASKKVYQPLEGSAH